jgi:serine/threonine-protein kinase SRPK3
MVFEILGVNLLEIIKRYNFKGVPMHLVRVLARQCLMGLDYMHRICNLIHTDLKPENVAICLDNKQLEQILQDGFVNHSKKVDLPH